MPLNSRNNEYTRISVCVCMCIWVYYYIFACIMWSVHVCAHFERGDCDAHVYLGQVGYRCCGMLLFSVAALWIRCLQHRHLIYKVLLFRLPPTYWKASRALICVYKRVYNVPHVACHNQWLTVGALMSDEWRKIKAAVGYCSCYLQQGRGATSV